ncbi:phospholipase B1, membrane-associated-like [Ptychodera flava]|uniref:phospholipase B1, membrane-associated-like n=1 Tax=Ptychodera flava TaxID=63121 RepID=UPI00396A3032
MKGTLLMLSLFVSQSLTLSQGNSHCDDDNSIDNSSDGSCETSFGTSIYEPDKYTKVSNPPLGNPPTDERSSQPPSESFGMTDFPCDVSESNSPIPESVHKLRPGDIKVIGALGDSLTAANGADASWILSVFFEYRGLSWSIGGDKKLDKITTLPNMLKLYNEDLIGYSTGTGWLKRVKARFNVAVRGSKSTDMVAQARKLIEEMKKVRGNEYVYDWKMVTLFVGGNDLCDWVNATKGIQPEEYKGNIKEALDLLEREMPRTFVNLVQAPNVTQLAENTKKGCRVIRSMVCRSVIHGDRKKNLGDIIKKYRQELRSLVEDFYEDSDTFTVVVQPMFEEIILPRLERSDRVDGSYFAPDCFHFSRKGHEAAAKALWNNLFEPLGEKTNNFDPKRGIPLKCPTEENPYICTRKNGRACN